MLSHLHWKNVRPTIFQIFFWNLLLKLPMYRFVLLCGSIHPNYRVLLYKNLLIFLNINLGLVFSCLLLTPIVWVFLYMFPDRGLPNVFPRVDLSWDYFFVAYCFGEIHKTNIKQPYFHSYSVVVEIIWGTMF